MPPPPRTLAAAQRLFAAAIFRPLTPQYLTPRTWLDGKTKTAAIIAPLIKPNDRLSSLDRLEIYHRQYWFRLLDSLYDDFPGLRAILGQRRFHRLSIAYLAECPSRSFTLRNLGQFLPAFLARHPKLAAPHAALVRDMARFEWAQVLAFDNAAHPPLSAADLTLNPARLRLALQPHLQLLDLAYPLDDFLLAVKKRDTALRHEASNAVPLQSGADAPAARPGSGADALVGRSRAATRPRLPRRHKTFLVVHRFDNALYYKRLTPAAFTLLALLQSGLTIQSACRQLAAAAPNRANPAALANTLRTTLETATQLGWLTHRPERSHRPAQNQ